MIKATLFYQDNVLEFVRIKGHANYHAKGSDIVCSACSVLVRTVIRYLETVNGVTVESIGSNGLFFGIKRIEKRLPTEVAVQLLTMGLADLESEFPNHIKLVIKRK